jgi:sensor histidine kinase YesM
MKKLDLDTILDQRRFYSHCLFLFISLLGVVFFSITNTHATPLWNRFGFFLLIVAYLEAFIFLARKIFRNTDTDTTGKEFLRKILYRFLIFYITCFLSALFIYIIFQYFVYSLSGMDHTKVIYNFVHYGFWTWFKSTIIGLSFGAIVFVFIQWQAALRREQKLREENLIFQNETLKNQVNPHFLFNCLNTLSSLLQTQPDTAERFIGRLSSIYRYILENCPKDRVPLLSEISFIGDYFYLHKIRDDDKIQLEISAAGADKFEILPVSLQVLIENAIKHNKATRENPLKISIYIENQNIIVKNNLQKMATLIKSTKIGLKNLAFRVKLITGRDLIIEETHDCFLVKVPLLL